VALAPPFDVVENAADMLAPNSRRSHEGGGGVRIVFTATLG